jgi:hypothetical protein
MLEPSNRATHARVDARRPTAVGTNDRASVQGPPLFRPVAVRACWGEPQSPVPFVRMAPSAAHAAHTSWGTRCVQLSPGGMGGSAGMWVHAGVPCHIAAAQAGIFAPAARVALEWRAVYGAAGLAIHMGYNWIDVARVYGITQAPTLVALQIFSVFSQVVPSLAWGGDWRVVALRHDISSPYAIRVLQDTVANRFAFPFIDAGWPWGQVATAFGLDAPGVRSALQRRLIAQRVPGLLALDITRDAIARLLDLDGEGRAELEALASAYERQTLSADAHAHVAAWLLAAHP